LVSHVQSGAKNLFKLVPSLKALPKESKLDDKEILSSSPLYKGIKNHLRSSIETIESYMEGDGLNIFDMAAKVSFLDPSHIFDRDHTAKVKMMKSVLKKSLQTYMPKDGMIFYGSSIGSHSMDTSSYITSSLWNLEFIASQLDEYGVVQQEVDA
jgi:hypothetical protein